MADNRIGQFTIRPILERVHGQAVEMEEMVARIRALNLAKRPPSTVQCASTQATLDRDPAKDAEHWNRPLPPEVVEKNKQLAEAYRVGDLATLSKLTEARDISPEEYGHAEAARRRPKNTVGQSTNKGSSDSLLEKAVNSFLFSPPAELTNEERKRIAEMQPYAPPPPLVEVAAVEVKKSNGPLDRLMGILWRFVD